MPFWTKHRPFLTQYSKSGVDVNIIQRETVILPLFVPNAEGVMCTGRENRRPNAERSHVHWKGESSGR